MTRQRLGAILAALSLALHKTPLPSGVLPLSLRDLIEAMLREDARGLPPHIAAGILALIERLSPGDGLCHCDLHPGNVIMTAEGPRLVDWSGAVRAPAALDLASIHVLLAELAPEIADDPERPRAVNAAAQSEYARLAGLSEAALAAAMAPYLPIVRARVAHALPDRRARLIPRIEADLSRRRSRLRPGWRRRSPCAIHRRRGTARRWRCPPAGRRRTGTAPAMLSIPPKRICVSGRRSTASRRQHPAGADGVDANALRAE